MKNTLMIIFGGLIILIVLMLGKIIPLFLPSEHETVEPFQIENSDSQFTELEQKTVYKDVLFGISNKEYELAVPEYINSIAGSSFKFRPKYNYEGRLYNLSIEGFSVSAKFIDTKIASEIETLKKVIIEKYGAPHEIYSDYHFFNFDPGYIQWIYKWNIGDKKIKIGAAEERSGSRYYSIMSIYSESMKKEVDNVVETESKEIIKSDSQNF